MCVGLSGGDGDDDATGCCCDDSASAIIRRQKKKKQGYYTHTDPACARLAGRHSSLGEKMEQEQKTGRKISFFRKSIS